jgi:hypothetical protein
MLWVQVACCVNRMSSRFSSACAVNMDECVSGNVRRSHGTKRVFVLTRLWTGASCQVLLLDDWFFLDWLPTLILCEGVVHTRKKENSQSESHFHSNPTLRLRLITQNINSTLETSVHYDFRLNNAVESSLITHYITLSGVLCPQWWNVVSCTPELWVCMKLCTKQWTCTECHHSRHDTIDESVNWVCDLPSQSPSPPHIHHC